MRPESEYQEALKLVRSGVSDSDIGRRLGIPRGTIKSWRYGLLADSRGRTEAWTGDESKTRTGTCFRCNREHFDEDAYAYLLGMYLGDGWIWAGPRNVYQLRITCDLKYPDIINEVATRIVMVRGVETVGFATRTGCVDVNAYWKHWPCVFPQHGPGRKHERRIELAVWQRTTVTAHPKSLIRGLIHSDGNRHINAIRRQLPSGVKHYQYPRYMFTNASTDILEIFTDALDTLGVHWTQTSPRDISVARRDDVGFIDSFVGPKS